jgi:hypothetical protein
MSASGRTRKLLKDLSRAGVAISRTRSGHYVLRVGGAIEVVGSSAGPATESALLRMLERQRNRAFP